MFKSHICLFLLFTFKDVFCYRRCSLVATWFQYVTNDWKLTSKKRQCATWVLTNNTFDTFLTFDSEAVSVNILYLQGLTKNIPYFNMRLKKRNKYTKVIISHYLLYKIITNKQRPTLVTHSWSLFLKLTTVFRITSLGLADTSCVIALLSSCRVLERCLYTSAFKCTQRKISLNLKSGEYLLSKKQDSIMWQ